nr:uncharacterized protein LOC129380525 [Dermacentor andersoni]
MSSNPFVFLMQVRKHFGKCHKSNGIFLVVLPCPGKCNLECSLALQVDDLENRSRRSNLIFYGIPEVENERPDDLKRTISDKIIKGTIGVTVSGIERMHRLGTKAENKTQPVILKLQCFEDKVNILKNCAKLKNSNISVGEDFSIRVRNIRKELWNSSKSNRDRGEKVTLVYDKIKINGQVYVWDEHKGARVPVGKKPAVPKKKKLTKHETPSSLVIVNINARSVVNESTEFEAFIIEHRPDILTITETWLSPDVSSSDIFPPGYTVMRKDRSSRGGGVAILIRENIYVTPMPEMVDAEALWCKIMTDLSSLFLGTMYRPPDTFYDMLHVLANYM